ncbi:MAG: hypothetical protein NTZ55_02575, partial [Candidatus Roizmanbacteria bacterium]|nr:hypothetical protein [Candidatus Roizmanbacteria bacterium]
ANGTGAAGGGGAYSFSVLPVMPGETITVSVGGGGSTGACGAGTAGGVGGSGGYGTGGRGGAAGSTGSSCSGGGGGAGSFVLRGSTVLLAAAGGGGGAGAEGGSAGPGGGGGVNGGAGAYGAGGTTNANQSVNGAVGGSVGGGDASGGGGAGGGYNGGTGGAAPSGDSLGGGGGAGGASLGVAVLNGSGTTPGNSSDADRGTAGNGGAIYAAGTAGKVVISAVSLKPKQGKMGKAGTFNGTSDYISVPDNSSFDLGTGDFNISFWANHNSLSTYNTYFEMGLYTAGILMRQDTPTTLNIYLQYLTSADVYSYSLAPQLNQWYHFSLNRQGGYLKLYVNGQQIGTTTASSQNIQVSGPLYIGHSAHAAATQYLNGSLDEFVISNTYRSADDIRQAYEIGTRTHKVTIDFGAKLDGGNLIANSSDKLFTVDATYYGLNSKGSNIYLGDKIIVRESYGGVEYIAQGTVNSVVESTGVVTVAAWDGGSTFPIGGFTADASVFKWQKEYFDITGSLGTQRSAISRLSLRPTNGNEGRTIWLDDIRSSGNYLTSPTGSTITSSIGNRYFQYRTILSSFDSAVSATLSAVTIDYSSNNAPNTPSLDLPVDASINQSVTPVFKTTTTDFETNYIRYKILLCTNLAMTTDCQTFDQTSTQTGWTGQDTQMGTAYVSGTQATYTIATELNPSTTYYWRSYAIDPAGSGNWSTTQAVPKSFTTTSAPSSPTSLQAQGLTNPTVSTLTPYFSALHNDPVGNAANKYQVQVNTNNTFTGTTMWDSGQVSMATTASGARIPNVTYAGTSLVFNGTTYYWRIRLTNILNATGTWSSPASFKLSTPPNTPVLDLPSNTAIDVTVQPMLRITATDVDSDYLQYKIQICTNLAMTSNCLVFDQTSSQTGWSGQDAQTGTAYVSGTQASFTPSSPLSIVTAYYWRSYAIDPGGSNVWSGTQSNIYSFTTTNAPLYGTGCVVRESNNDSSLLVRWSDNAFDENGYEVRRSVDGGAYVELATNIPPNSTSYQDISITTGHTYSYQIAPYFTAGPTYGTWCTTVPLSIQRGTFTIKGVKLN